MRTDRLLLAAAVLWSATATSASAQPGSSASSGHVTGPLALILPVSARNAALGNAAVAGRDDFSVFANPARVSSTNGFGLTVAAYGNNGRAIAAVSGATMGPITLGWGIHAVDFSAPQTGAGSGYPVAPATLTRRGTAQSTSLLALVAGQMLYKGFRIGVAAKYAEDLAPRINLVSGLPYPSPRGDLFLVDIGTTHPLWGGVAALSAQNLSRGTYSIYGLDVAMPAQLALGWSAQYAWGAFDYGFTTQVAAQGRDWIAPAGGVEMGWSWIEGMNITARVGARRPETVDEKPVSAGFSLGADRLLLDYSSTFFTGNKVGHRLTVRWR
jgi:hypothetical protein